MLDIKNLGVDKNEMNKLNFGTYFEDIYQSKITTLYSLTENIEFNELHDYLYKYDYNLPCNLI